MEQRTEEVMPQQWTQAPEVENYGERINSIPSVHTTIKNEYSNKKTHILSHLSESQSSHEENK
jgi:hypothetical protein